MAIDITDDEAFKAFCQQIQASRIGKTLRITSLDGCWLWNGATKSRGYGTISWQGKEKMLHRLIYELVHDGIEPGKIIMHLCETPPCCNPRHLLAGTYQQNACHRWGWPAGTIGQATESSYKTPRTEPAERAPYVPLPPRSFGWPAPKPKVRKHRKLSSQQVEEIRTLSNSGHFQCDLATKFNVSRSLICRIVNGRVRHLT